MKILSPHAEIAKAFAYQLKQWNELILYCDNGWAEINNNITENPQRGVALGWKNSYDLYKGFNHTYPAQPETASL